MQWFRCYSDITDNYKLKMLSFEDRWHYIALLCCKSQGMLDGKRPDFIKRSVAVKLGLSSSEFDEVARRLAESYLIDQKTLQPIGWNDRQFVSDNSNERVKKYRQNRLNSGLPVGNAYQKHFPELIRRDEGKCVYCGSTENLCIDHVLPLCQGGTDDVLNLAISCKSCNSGKSGRTPDQAGYSMSEPALSAYKSFIKKHSVTVTRSKRNSDSNAPDTDTDTDTETPPVSPPSSSAIAPASPAPKASRGTRLPDDWKLPKAWGDWAMAERSWMTADDVRRESAIFADHWRSNSGRSGVKLDWEATWRNWIRRVAVPKGRSETPATTGNRYQTINIPGLL